MKNLYFFHWPSDLGGADTRLKDLIQGISSLNKYNLYCIPNDDFRLKEAHNVNFLKKNNVKIMSWNELPKESQGYAIAFCNFRLFSEKWRTLKIKEMGLKMIWSNDMMWTTSEEISALKENLIDVYLYTSQFHKQVLENKSPELKKHTSYILPNYFYPDNYRKIERKEETKNKFTIGKLSRADLMKFSENFPLFYEKMPIDNALFRIMGWSKELQNKYQWFNFDKEKWNLLPENKEGIIEFLSQLDLYVFNANHKYIENQTRAMVEAQLLGIPAIAPNYGNFPNIIWHGKNGFIYKSIDEAYMYIENIQKSKLLQEELKRNSLNLSKSIWCNIDSQMGHWENVFDMCD